MGGTPAEGMSAVALDAARVHGVCLDSRAVQPGDLYAALPGAKSHGARFAKGALDRGAAAIVTDPRGVEQLREADLLSAVPVLVTQDPRAVLGALSAAVYQSHTLAPETFAVTGTNGKTTTTYLLRSLLSALGCTTGLIGTIEILAGEEPIPSVLTTPEAPQLHALMSRMAQAGVSSAAMEVSSHSLEFRRVAGLRFAVSGFTNLTQDHLDLHGSMEEYLAAKARLFTPEYSDRAVVSVDDQWGQALAVTSADLGVPTATLLTRPARAGESADWMVTDVSRVGLGHRFGVRHRDGRSLMAGTELPGAFNVSNAALALVMLLEGGVSLETLQAALDSEDAPLTPSVPGRMQVVHTHPTAIVDFAHNPDALVRALESVRTDQGRVIVVFGATGERDTSKRPIMGELAARHSDVVIVTDDDPHGEEPGGIRAQVMQGARDAAVPGVELLEVAPRADAIAAAARMAGEHDVILVAGRGHEVWQEVKGVNLALDDREELRRAFGNGVSDSSSRIDTE
ncbi:UDP-N-acetylmuramoyl-L-alanyl-D-glutamate--2,6-diaminopimelate ligase [Galactobacter caseinivorans]|uniref:UDP-N-acetylmuramyl-tripeptide synthetase n=2 Tax=Galactobacter caseinivorans TaxID=2676123 RepID=A0A496PN92_9MICC|nr:UDP-N-acetylmuramoyl-L-alanyl-D-glutamate--2,6-diaminopimelate ligase [Galactobacter caseinivorans]